jgi:hypothetical protein
MEQLSISVFAALLLFGVSFIAIAEQPLGGGAAALSDSSWTPLFDGKSLRGKLNGSEVFFKCSDRFI